MKSYLEPYCMECGAFMACEITGFSLEINDGYDVVHGDLYKCPGCGWEIIINFGKPRPNLSHHPYIR